METEPAHPRRPALGWLCRPGADGAAAPGRRNGGPALRRPSPRLAGGSPVSLTSHHRRHRRPGIGLVPSGTVERGNSPCSTLPTRQRELDEVDDRRRLPGPNPVLRTRRVHRRRRRRGSPAAPGRRRRRRRRVRQRFRRLLLPPADVRLGRSPGSSLGRVGLASPSRSRRWCPSRSSMSSSGKGTFPLLNSRSSTGSSGSARSSRAGSARPARSASISTRFSSAAWIRRPVRRSTGLPRLASMLSPPVVTVRCRLGPSPARAPDLAGWTCDHPNSSRSSKAKAMATSWV